MDMPKPNEKHARLELLIGTWVGEENMPPSQWCPEAKTGIGRTECRGAIGGFGVVCDYEQSMDGQTTYSGHGIYTHDAGEDIYLLHWFDSMGMGVDLFKGDFDGCVLTMTTQGVMGHMRMTADYSTPGKLVSRMEGSQDGETWNLMFDGVYTRR